MLVASNLDRRTTRRNPRHPRPGRKAGSSKNICWPLITAPPRDIFDAALDHGSSLVEASLHIVQPALYRVGRKWQVNQVSVAQEHLATAIASMTMTRGLMKADSLPLKNSRVLLACVQGNHRAVGLQMVADAFQLDGWEMQFLGANIPGTALLSQIRAWQPHLLGLSVSFVQQLRVAKELLGQLRQEAGGAQPGVLVGGLAINRFEGLAALVGADAWCADAAAAVLAGNRLVAERSVA